jgi:glycosyltransferase involved in cell wall biosynthesis
VIFALFEEGGCMRIVNTLFARSLGGLEQVFLDYGLALNQQGHDVQMVCHPDGPFPTILEEMGLPVHTLANVGGWDPLAPMKLRRLLDDLTPDLVIGHGNRSLSLLTGPVTTLLGRPDYPIVGVAQNYKNKRFSRLSGAFCSTEDLQQRLHTQFGLPGSMLFHIPNMMAMPEQRPVRQPNNPVVIGTIGRFVKKKGFDVFLEALAILRERGYQFKAVLAGDGEEEKQALLDIVQRQQLDLLVEMPGWVMDKSTFYEPIDIFCLPSLHEPFGIVLLEAMAYHLPIVSTDTEGPQEIFTHNENALIVPKGDATAMADALAHLLEQPTLQQRLGANGFARFRDHYSMEVVGKHLSDAAKKMVAKNQQRQAA